MNPPYFRYWGKAQPPSDTEGSRYHLLPYHSLDVAAVVWLLFDPDKPTCQQLAESLGVSPEWLQNWFSFCAALHDVGKFSSAFQGLVTDLSDALITPDSTKSYTGVRHDALGYLLWDKQLKAALWENSWSDQQCWKRAKYAYKAWAPWLAIVTGHHGEPPSTKYLNSINRYYTEEDTQAAIEFTEAVNDLFQPDLAPLADDALKKNLMRVSWQLAGLMVLADWSGSNQSLFSYSDTPMPLSEYWDKIALRTSAEAIQRMKPERVVTQPFSDIQALFPFIEHPTPLQAHAATVEIPSGPQLWILEDVTGAGKTEAALTLVSRIMTKGLAEGVYIGLPTMATANGMYERMSKSYRALFDAESRPSLVLAHGARELSDAFAESKRLAEHQADVSYSAEELSASAYCNSWVADSRKKSLFADVGVGTIDQALLAVLPARHQSLRILGLRDKVLLVDEIHSFDPYLRSLLCSLLQAHAMQGGCVIMLSATLPQEMRNAYLNAYRSGRRLLSHALEAQSAHYPLVTCSASEVHEYPVESRASVSRSLAVEVLSDRSDVAGQIQRALENNQAVCWIRNTVDDARDAYQQALDAGWTNPDKTTLFHSRFAMCDRQVIETDVLERFGKDSTPEQRAGQLLIATQVIEQSLDLDFDLMITDLAPIDLIIQRAGRLQRHTRNASGQRAEHEQRPAPTLFIFAPAANEDIDEQWLLPQWRGTQAVYRHLGQLWLTLQAIEQQQWTIEMPGKARALIEAVYSADAQSRYPVVLEDASLDTEGQHWAESQQAKTNQLELSRGYCRESSEGDLWGPDTKTPTRLSDETITVVLVKQVDGELQPWADADQHRWPLSQINLREKDWQAASKLIPAELLTDIEELKETTYALKWVEVLPLVGELADCYSELGGWNLSMEER